MKRKIDREEIKAGDLIRFELPDEAAREHRTSFDADRSYPAAIRVYLLDRPEPVVVLPETPTLGWITQAYDYTRPSLGFFAKQDPRYTPDLSDDAPVASEYGSSRRKAINHHFRVESFTEAVAVPKEALEELRKSSILVSVERFFKAVDSR